MSTQTLRVRLSGERPLLMHSARLADPLDPITVELDRLTRKRDKTTADHEQISKVEWHGGLWLHDDRPCIPAEAIESAFVAAAKTRRKGRRVAYHEAGHAIALLALGIAEPKALSIGGAGGLAETDPGAMRAMTRSHLERFLVALLAGRAAEQLTFGEATAGAGGSEESDLGRATVLATRLETEYGLGAFGLVCIPGGASDRDLLLLDTLRSVVGGTIDRAYAAALELLGQNQHALEALATALFGAGYLDRADIAAILVHSPLGAQTTAVAPTVPAPEILDEPTDDTAIAGAASPNFVVKNQA